MVGGGVKEVIKHFDRGCTNAQYFMCSEIECRKEMASKGKEHQRSFGHCSVCKKDL